MLVVKTRLYMLMILLVMCLVLRVSLDLLDQVKKFEVLSSKIDEVPGSSDFVNNENGDGRQVSYPKKVRVASQGVSNLMKAMKSKKK